MKIDENVLLFKSDDDLFYFSPCGRAGGFHLLRY